MNKAERESEIAKLARGLAKLGTKFRSIEAQLRVQYPEAVSVLKDPFLRQEIELSCMGRSIYDF